MSWDETQTYIQNGLRSPSQFQENTLKTIQINTKDGIQAIVGKPKDKQTLEIQSYLFSKDEGWTRQKAQKWKSRHQVPVCLDNSQERTESTVKGEYTLGFYQDPGEFLPEHLTTVWLDEENGVLAVLGKLRAEPKSQRTVAIYFSSEKQWGWSQIQSWLAAHTAYIIPTGGTPTKVQDTPVVESLVRKVAEPTIAVSQVIGMIRAVLPSSQVQRSWGLGPQRMCQELSRVIYGLQCMAE